jgi:transglutaminase-like putative cysteine protease
VAVAINNLAAEIAGPAEADNVEARAQRLTDWLHASLEWVATDYEQRTVDEILARRAGNCAEQAKVLDALLNGAGIKTRWIAEINIHPPSEQRAADSAALIPELGPRATVFGYQHNDHRWLEIYDAETEAWLPADATLGIVGYGGWIEARLGFGARPKEAVEMIAPFCVVVLDLDRVLHDNLTRRYLVDQFNEHFDGQLAALPAWDAWCAGVAELGKLGALAFQNQHDLRQDRGRIQRLNEAYHHLREQAREAGLE